MALFALVAAMPASVLLPFIEVVGGAGLLVDVRGSLTTIAGLLLLFMLILGYKNVYRYPGGIFAWKGAKYPSESVK